MADSLAGRIVAHHLSLLGWPSAAPAPLVLDRASPGDAAAARAAVAAGRPVIAQLADPSFCDAFGLHSAASPSAAPALFAASHAASSSRWRLLASRLARRPAPRSCLPLRTLHPWHVYRAADGAAVLEDAKRHAAWWWLPLGAAGVLFLGTDLSADLVRYRQGDPAQLEGSGRRDRWSYAGERPNYLFEAQRAGEPPHARHADAWAWLLARTLAERTATRLEPLLPGGAPGAVVLTGDDDQAALDAYRQQLALLGDAPITYFLHPLTKHGPETLRTLLGRPGIEIGLHPDALDAPDAYDARFREQAAWFRRLVGHAPRSVRNHGFLNRGYWGHLDAWLTEGVVVSSNLPGFDGTVLNGSLLPARVVRDGALTDHWSILTAVGDGVLFEKRWSSDDVGARVRALGEDVIDSGLPGVLVFNLHPENALAARALHEAALGLVARGFVAWGLEQCVEWFRRRDATAAPADPPREQAQRA